jgi:hypothetical protein
VGIKILRHEIPDAYTSGVHSYPIIWVLSFEKKSRASILTVDSDLPKSNKKVSVCGMETIAIIAEKSIET